MRVRVCRDVFCIQSGQRIPAGIRRVLQRVFDLGLHLPAHVLPLAEERLQKRLFPERLQIRILLPNPQKDHGFGRDLCYGQGRASLGVRVALGQYGSVEFRVLVKLPGLADRIVSRQRVAHEYLEIRAHHLRYLFNLLHQVDAGLYAPRRVHQHAVHPVRFCVHDRVLGHGCRIRVVVLRHQLHLEPVGVLADLLYRPGPERVGGRHHHGEVVLL